MKKAASVWKGKWSQLTAWMQLKELLQVTGASITFQTISKTDADTRPKIGRLSAAMWSSGWFQSRCFFRDMRGCLINVSSKPERLLHLSHGSINHVITHIVKCPTSVKPQLSFCCCSSVWQIYDLIQMTGMYKSYCWFEEKAYWFVAGTYSLCEK